MKTTIKDIRPSFGAELTIQNNKVYFAGSPVQQLIPSAKPLFKSNHIFSIISCGANCGDSALKDEDLRTVNELLNPIEFTRVNSDVNGNPRFVCHFLSFINEGDKAKADTRGLGFISYKYQLALNKAKQLGGRKFHNKQYGGGIVFQMYDGQRAEMSLKIRELAKVNTTFKKEWSTKEFKQVERAIKNHFTTHTYKHITEHGQKPTEKHFFNFQDIDNFLGLAYTSTGDFAGLWCCNGGYLYATEKHNFIGFAINELNEVVAIAEDENENPIYIVI